MKTYPLKIRKKEGKEKAKEKEEEVLSSSVLRGIYIHILCKSQRFMEGQVIE